MKTILPSILLIFVCQFAFSQDTFHNHNSQSNQKEKNNDAPSSGFDEKNLFFGGSLSLGYSTNYGSYNDPNTGLPIYFPATIFNVGCLPEVGYKFSNVFEAGLEGNVNYYSTSSSQYSTIKIHDFDYGIGAFARISPIEAFFIQVMPEIDFIKRKSISSNYTTKATYHTNSFLAGAGYKYQSESDKHYFYAVLLIDLARGYTPYKTYDQTGGMIPIPILRLAYNYFPFR